MAVMFGALVWVFQDGYLSGLLGFTPSGSIEPSIPILMFCTAFALSMDYEVFMLSRIKEEYDRTGDTVRAVAVGLERSGPLITSAAVILAASFATYASSGIVFLKMLGLGMVVVILVDATLIRAVLVPVFIRLAGTANWWAPAPLRALHDPGSGSPSPGHSTHAPGGPRPRASARQPAVAEYGNSSLPAWAVMRRRSPPGRTSSGPS
ncbi:MMPL family transporter [Streptomyces sp. 8N706]|uniref:MMPL family transporter n=1 Tax=Streptomyces sp. 8N706 TaxID=3457416 RepID=UPI003FD3B75D